MHSIALQLDTTNKLSIITLIIAPLHFHSLINKWIFDPLSDTLYLHRRTLVDAEWIYLNQQVCIHVQKYVKVKVEYQGHCINVAKTKTTLHF